MKTCLCGCGWPVFSHGYAKYCQYKRTDDKKPKRLQYHVIKCEGESLALKYGKNLNFGFESEIDMFNHLWEEAKNEKGQVICPYTNEKLNRFYNTLKYFSCFAHVLPKGRYTYWKMNPINVCVVHPDFHVIVDQGTFQDRAAHPMWRFDAWDKKREELKIQYQEFKKRNLLA